MPWKAGGLNLQQLGRNKTGWGKNPERYLSGRLAYIQYMNDATQLRIEEMQGGGYSSCITRKD